jgi:hypothetical protein
MNKTLYHVFGDFDYEALIWTDKGWRDPNELEGARVILFEDATEAQQCAAAVRQVKGGHETNQRLPLDTNPNEEMPGDGGWHTGSWVMSDELDEVWPEV